MPIDDKPTPASPSKAIHVISAALDEVLARLKGLGTKPGDPARELIHEAAQLKMVVDTWADGLPPSQEEHRELTARALKVHERMVQYLAEKERA